MADTLRALERLISDVNKVAIQVESSTARTINTADVQPRIAAIAKLYFGSIRTHLEGAASRKGVVEEIDYVVQQLLSFAGSRKERAAYTGQFSELRPYLLEAQIDLMKAKASSGLVLSKTEQVILETLQKLLPTSAASYEQVLRDIHEANRVSWRGTSSELREVLRNVIDELAPDDKVESSEGYVLERDRKGPTQAQKVKYILRARKSRTTAVDTAKQSLAAVDAAIADLARSTYNRGSASTHSTTDGVEVRRIKHYVDAVLAELHKVSILNYATAFKQKFPGCGPCRQAEAARHRSRGSLR
jgi:Predicted pPIWI-associating nuclease